MLPFGASNIQEFNEQWNKRLPIDRWYRKKYNIPFNSISHREICLADMFFEFYEFLKYNKPIKKEEEQKQEPYEKGKGNFMKEVEYTQVDIDRLFDELDIDKMD